ncbi:hypothetical protein NG895_02655 [Aeoliella sp. ICT_H6.2]|uniref:Uncharacterized protein n=1 Tax=Aeoliella straminimaris TaxID=2954799 RepID=A0A9X2F6X2_9BACT|nr:hypothetical protein [Aeoliella straminimaris]MCO6042798.1 hypothetical protein [Aeoliella straminimaris]
MRRYSLYGLMLMFTLAAVLCGVFAGGVLRGKQLAAADGKAALSVFTDQIAAEAKQALSQGDLPRAYTLTQLLKETAATKYAQLRRAYAQSVIAQYNAAMEDCDLLQCKALLTRETIAVLKEECPGLFEQLKAQLNQIRNHDNERRDVSFSLLSFRTKKAEPAH